MYKVFLVEDEIVAREGIRDTVPWQAAGFEFCGEAPDGEIAFPQIEKARPDVLITDIKMPFMDGLQLSRIVREHMPWIKIVILSGHDEFEYARTALKIGVTEYLLKPVSSADIIDVLQRVAVSLDQEKSERENQKQLKSQVEYNLLLRREQLLLRLVMGGIPSGDAIEQGHQLGLNLVAQHYLVLLIKIELFDAGKPYDYDEYQRVEKMVSNLARNNTDILWTKKDVEELVLILKGDDREQLVQDGQFWAELIRKERANDTARRLIVEMGSPQERLSDIHHSFAEALAKAQNLARLSLSTSPQESKEQIELQKLDHEALESVLKFGDLDAFEAFFENDLAPICESALQSDVVMHYVFLEVFLTIAQFVSDLSDGDSDGAPEIQEIKEILHRVTTIEQIRTELRQMISSALNFRDNRANHQRTVIIQRARAYIDDHFCDPDLQMSHVAKTFNLSPNYFSTVFSQEIGETFRDYLNNLRIDRAKELLRTTNIKCIEVARQSGYNDSHYFSTFFKKKTGLTPQQFRKQSRTNKS
ncbi:MAG: response regulator [Anaerolineae bacterium]|nr:response regulator [Anaerolineae bacterium]